MEERILDEEMGRKIRVKKLADGETDVVDGLSEETGDAPVAEEDGEEMVFEIPEMAADDEDLVGLSPEEAMALRKRKAEEAAARRAEYEKTVAEGDALLAEGSFHAAELAFEKALRLDDVATEASVGYWRAKTENFANPDVLMDEYVEAGYENLEFDLGYEAVEIIKAEHKESFQRRFDELTAEEGPLREEVLAAQERRRAILKPRLKKSGVLFGVTALPFLAAVALTVLFILKNFTVRDGAYTVPAIIAGVAAAVTFAVFGVFTNRFINSGRIYRANEKLSSTDDGARLEEIAEYKDLYSKFL